MVGFNILSTPTIHDTRFRFFAFYVKPLTTFELYVEAGSTNLNNDNVDTSSSNSSIDCDDEIGSTNSRNTFYGSQYYKEYLEFSLK